MSCQEGGGSRSSTFARYAHQTWNAGKIEWKVERRTFEKWEERVRDSGNIGKGTADVWNIFIPRTFDAFNINFVRFLICSRSFKTSNGLKSGSRLKHDEIQVSWLAMNELLTHRRYWNAAKFLRLEPARAPRGSVFNIYILRSHITVHSTSTIHNPLASLESTVLQWYYHILGTPIRMELSRVKLMILFSARAVVKETSADTCRSQRVKKVRILNKAPLVQYMYVFKNDAEKKKSRKALIKNVPT